MYNTNKKVTYDVLNWYKKTKRQLPFRNSNDPYKIWLSEIMLQQTQMQTVIPYYNRWIKQYPTLKSVAQEKIEKLLKLWEGLGYYNRCRNFHRAAKIIVFDKNGQIPDNFNQFRSLPGVGDYTAGAVLSIAFNKQCIAIDGNIRRLISRVLGIKKFTYYNKRRIEKWLKKHISKLHPGDFNQSLMELGSLVCNPKNPKCHQCPISYNCKAFLIGHPEAYPEKTHKKKIPSHTIVAGILWRENKFYIQKRTNSKMLAGLWEFPGGKVQYGESLEQALKREIEEECGIHPKIIKKIGSIKHNYSHFSIIFHAFHCKEDKDIIKKEKEARWISINEIKQFPFPKANHKLFDLLNDQNWNV